MPAFILVFIASIAIIGAVVTATRAGKFNASSSRILDWVVFVFVLISFIFATIITARLSIFVDETNIPISEVMGGLLLNLALFFVPMLLFVAALLSLSRLVQKRPRAVAPKE